MTVALLLFGGVIHEKVRAQDSSSAVESATQEATPSPADLAFKPIQNKVRRLYDSLRNKGGIAIEDYALVRSVRDEAAEFSRQFPDDPRGYAVELQLSEWIKEDHRVDELYSHLMRVLSNRNDVRLAWAKRLKLYGRYGEALRIINEGALDPAKEPDAMLVQSECLFAEHRFQDALEALDAIPQEVLDNDVTIKSQVDQVRPDREAYIALWQEELNIRRAGEEADDLPSAMIVTQRGAILVELFENQAPNTVANFISLADQGFYNGTKFHRVLPHFMVQGGDPNSREGASGTPGQGNPGYYIPDEHQREDHRKHFSGSLAMAKQTAPNTGGCQFYLCHTPTPWLNGQHTVFGRVTEGLEVVRAIQQDDVIESITVLWRREHIYQPETLPLTSPATQPATQPVDTATTIPGVSSGILERIDPSEITEQGNGGDPDGGDSQSDPASDPAPEQP